MKLKNEKVYQSLFSERRFEQIGNLYVLTKRSHQLNTKHEWYSMIVNKFMDMRPLGFKIRHMEIPVPYELLTILNTVIETQKKGSRMGSKSPLIREAIAIKIEQSLGKNFKIHKKTCSIPGSSSKEKRVGVSTWASEETFQLINRCVENEMNVGLVQTKKEWILKAVAEYLEQYPNGIKTRGIYFHIDHAKIDHFLKIQKKLNGKGSFKQIISEAFNSEIFANYTLLHRAGLS